MLVTQQEIEELKKFVLELNSNVKSVVVVEGKRDVHGIKEDWICWKNPRIS